MSGSTDCADCGTENPEKSGWIEEEAPSLRLPRPSLEDIHHEGHEEHEDNFYSFFFVTFVLLPGEVVRREVPGIGADLQ